MFSSPPRTVTHRVATRRFTAQSLASQRRSTHRILASAAVYSVSVRPFMTRPAATLLGSALGVATQRGRTLHLSALRVLPRRSASRCVATRHHSSRRNTVKFWPSPFLCAALCIAPLYTAPQRATPQRKATS